MIRSITKIHLGVIELSKWVCLATRKEENYKYISKQVLSIDKHKNIKRGIPGSSEKLGLDNKVQDNTKPCRLSTNIYSDRIAT